MRRFALVVIPILAAVTTLIGLYFIYVGGRTVIMGRHVGIGLGFAGFGAVGLILAYALWSVRQQILARLLEPAGEERRS
jgi:tetrahydromethanopterin S-methyltransferase subunit D